jgi:hypothetical protein
MGTVKCQVTGKDVPEGAWERETIIRWDDGTYELMLYTASPKEARRWEKRGVPVKPYGGRGWQVIVDKREWRVGVRKARKVVISNTERERRREMGRLALAKAHEARRMRKVTTGGDNG